MDPMIERFRKLDTTSVADAMDKLGAECSVYGVKPLQFGQRICGRAFTVHYSPCGVVHGTVGDFLDEVRSDQVIVIDNDGRDDCTVWGGIMAQVAAMKNLEGTVIDGVCRDIPEILSCGYPVFSKGTYMRTGKDRVFVDAVNVPVKLSDIPVRPGDLILGDDSGIVVVPAEMEARVAEIAESIDAKEALILQYVREGMTLKDAREKTGYHHLQTREGD